MDSPLIGLAGFAIVLFLIALRIPVAVSMASVGIVGGFYVTDWNSVSFMLGSVPFESAFPYSLSVVPLFILMGSFASRSGLSEQLYRAVNALIGHYRGGLAGATIGACAAFGAVCGSSLATAATMGRVALPEMKKYGYSQSFAAGVVAAGGTLGVLIPPSIILVIYGILTEQSIGRLFFAALIPGALGTALYIGAVMITAWLKPELAPAAEKRPLRERLRQMFQVWPVALLFAVVMGGMYVGWFSPTEAAAIGAFGSFIYALFRGYLTRGVARECAVETATTTGMIFLILAGTGLFNFFIESSGTTRFLVDQVKALDWNNYLILVVIICFYLVLGCFMDSLSMILLTVPSIFPVVTALGFDPIWFGILIVTVVEIGLITPPVGMNLFILVGIDPTLRIGDVYKGIVPFLFADLIRVVLIVAFPVIALWLPSLMR
ncbi:MAG: TRAP transporter large permease [Alphaproteobacteria bacterium]